MNSEKVIGRTIRINAAPTAVWEALTTEKHIRKWISDDDTEIVSDWKTGSRIVYRGSIHGLKYEDKGFVLNAVPCRLLEYSYWSEISELADEPQNYMQIRFELLPAGAGATQLTLRQHNFANEVIYAHWNFYWIATLQIFKRLAEQLP